MEAYERILRHEVGPENLVRCVDCRTGIINRACGDPECHCTCNEPTILSVPKPPEGMTFQVDSVTPLTIVNPVSTSHSAYHTKNEIDEKFIEAQIGNAVAPGSLLLTGAFIGGAIGTVTAYPSIPLTARIVAAVILVLALLLMLANTVDRTRDAT